MLGPNTKVNLKAASRLVDKQRFIFGKKCQNYFEGQKSPFGQANNNCLDDKPKLVSRPNVDVWTKCEFSVPQKHLRNFSEKDRGISRKLENKTRGTQNIILSSFFVINVHLSPSQSSTCSSGFFAFP